MIEEQRLTQVTVMRGEHNKFGDLQPGQRNQIRWV